MSQLTSLSSKISLHTDRLIKEFLMELSSDDFQQPRLSLFQPTHRYHPENQQNPIRFHCLVEELEFLLLKNHPTAQVCALLEPLDALERDAEFWRHTLHGLAVFATPGWLKVIRLPHTVQEFTLVGDSFHTNPLKCILQSADCYYLPDLNLDEIKLYEDDRETINNTDIPLTFTAPGI